jgi:predicted RNase H-like nuclease
VTDAWQHIGVDWDTGSWVAVGYTGDGTPDAGVFESIEALWDAHGAAAARVVVDVPIGLCESEGTGCVETDGERSRRCDDLARTVLGSRSSSVFTPPCRDVARLAAEGDHDHSTLSDLNREQTGKGLMRQAANIADGIIEVEAFLHERDSRALLEGHPEVCFRAFAGEELAYNKRTAPGMAERLAALTAVAAYEPGTWRELAGRLGERGHDPGTDDLLDALALALTARAPEGAFQTLPSEPPEDAVGLPVQMVYRRAEPFEM